MGSKEPAIHILFFPFMASGHFLPMVDVAKLFAAHGADATILTTPANANLIRPTTDRANTLNTKGRLRLHVIPFPSSAVGLPEGIESMSLLSLEHISSFMKGVGMLRQPFDDVLGKLRPDCVISDAFLPWTYDVAAEMGIPRIVFKGNSLFSECAFDSFERNQPLESLPPEAESIVLHDLPHRIELLRSQVRDNNKPDPSSAARFQLFKHAKEVSPKCYGVVFNSFYDLEPDYVEHYRNVVGGRSWHVGPVSLCNQVEADKQSRGGGDRAEEILKWLEGRKPRSVVYMCFGSLGGFTAPQLREMALGLEASGHPFIWAVQNARDDWAPEGFEERIQGRGLVIRGWAPQLLILNHEAVGGFITHCGWNSSLEGISAGQPLGTWPLGADQFYNELLLVDVLKIGVAVGSKVFGLRPEERPVIEAEKLESAIRRLMGEGEEAEVRRIRARELKEMAQRAMEEGGSSYLDIEKLIKGLRGRS